MNRGSATLKSALYEAVDHEELLLSMTVDQADGSRGRLKIGDVSGSTLFDSQVDSGAPDTALEVMFAWLGEYGFLSGLAAAGQRLVHGGSRYREPQRITPEFLTEIERLIPLDPDHMPAAIRGIKIIAKKLLELPQVASPDTAFHNSLPAVARMYAVSGNPCDQGIVRYGFHGLSYEYVMGELQALEGKRARGRVITANLGNGMG